MKKDMSGLHSRTMMYDKYIRYLFIASAIMMTVIVLTIIIFVGRQGLMTFKEVSPIAFFFGTNWDPPYEYGAFSFIYGSLAVTAIAVLLGGPLGLAGAVFMSKIAPPRMRALMRPATDLYVAIPSVVYGFIGLTVLVPFIRSTLHTSTGFGLLAAGIVLAVMILPTVITISEDALRSVPRSLEEASLALGATRWQTLWRVVIPSALPGILASIILAMARAIGETMAVQMLIGNTPQIPFNLVTPTSTLPSEIVVEMGNTPFGSAWNNSLFLMALVLLIISLLLILAIRYLAKKNAMNASNA